MNKISFIKGIKNTFPLFIGVIPFGITYGIFAKTVGLSASKTILMSVFVFAVASQFIALELTKHKSFAFTIILMTFIVNLRHILMSLSLKPYLEKKPKLLKFFLAFGIHDESYLTSINHYKKNKIGSLSFLAGSSLLMYIGWVSSSSLGFFLSEMIEDPFKWGLDFTMTITFITMLMPEIKNKEIVFVVLVSGIISIFMIIYVSSTISILISTFIGASVGFLMNKKKLKNK